MNFVRTSGMQRDRLPARDLLPSSPSMAKPLQRSVPGSTTI